MLWEQWSPSWNFDEAVFERTAIAFHNPDFVDVVIHCYRFGFGAAERDPALPPLARRLDERPRFSVPTVTLEVTQHPLNVAELLITHPCSAAVTNTVS